MRNIPAHGKVCVAIWIFVSHQPAKRKRDDLMDFSKMTGYEFEDYIAQLLRKKGFIVTQTSYSGDGGVDMIAMFDKPLFAGKYIVQCKNYSGLVGQPEIRDLYGVVMAETANKGILITPSDFTEQAYEFAHGKQLELVNGEILQELLTESAHTKVIASGRNTFTGHDDFNLSRYEYLKKKVEENSKEETHYRDLYNFLYDYICLSIMAGKYEQCTNGLFEEVLSLIQSWKNRCYKGKSKDIERTMCDLMASNILLISGEISQATEILISCGKNYCRFSPYEEFWPYEVQGGTFDFCANNQGGIRHEETNISNRSFFASNLYSAFKCIGFKRGILFLQQILKPRRNVDDYIDCTFSGQTATQQDVYHMHIHGIPFGLYDIVHCGTPTVSKQVMDELEQFCQWYQKFEDGAFDDRFLITKTLCKNGTKKSDKCIITTIDSYQKSAISFTDLKNAFCKKTNSEMCSELDIVFDNHGL